MSTGVYIFVHFFTKYPQNLDAFALGARLALPRAW